MSTLAPHPTLMHALDTPVHDIRSFASSEEQRIKPCIIAWLQRSSTLENPNEITFNVVHGLTIVCHAAHRRQSNSTRCRPEGLRRSHSKANETGHRHMLAFKYSESLSQQCSVLLKPPPPQSPSDKLQVSLPTHYPCIQSLLSVPGSPALGAHVYSGPSRSGLEPH